MLLGAVASQPASGFDTEHARKVLDKIEALSSRCDIALKAYAESVDGLRSIFKGTIAPGGDCKPANALNNVMTGAAIAACAQPDAYACLPRIQGAWTCLPHAAVGDACFSDANCMPGFYCDNYDLNPAGSTCMARKPNGGTCMHSHECQSLARDGTTCVPPTPKTVYCR